MASKRQQKKHIPGAIGWILVIVGYDLKDPRKRKDAVSFSNRAKLLFNKSAKTRFIYLELRSGVDLAFSQTSLDTIVIRFSANFSEARSLFAPWHEAWQRDVPDWIQRSFRLAMAADMSRELFEASEE